MQTAGALDARSFVPGLLLHYFGRAGSGALCCVNGVLLSVLSIPLCRELVLPAVHANFNQMLFTGPTTIFTRSFSSRWCSSTTCPCSLAGPCCSPTSSGVACAPRFAAAGSRTAWTACACPRPQLAWPAGLPLYLDVYIAVPFLGIFGGSLGWQTAVNWENAGVTKDEFLNEAILDNVQAIYRAYNLNERMLACNGLDFTTEDIRNLAARLSGKPADTDDLDVYLTKEAQGPQVEKPKQVIVILSESFANWPLLDKYEAIPISHGMRSLIAEDDTDYCPTFLPNGASTVSAVGRRDGLRRCQPLPGRRCRSPSPRRTRRPAPCR